MLNEIVDTIRSLLCGQYGRKYIQNYGAGGIYALYELDLSETRTNERFEFDGDSIIIQEIDNSASLRLNSVDNAPIDLMKVRWISSPYDKFYITNTASAGDLKILVGHDGIFRSGSISPIDIATNSIGNLPINIAANSIGNLPVDIEAQTLGNLDVDIAASSLGNLPVDIKASTIGNIDVDIAAQSIGNIDFDISAQSLSRVKTQLHYGAVESSQTASETISHDETHDFVDYDGSGAFCWATFYAAAVSESHKIAPYILIDNTAIYPSAFMMANFNSHGYNTNTSPVKLLNYAVDGDCDLIWIPPYPIPFDSNLKIRVYGAQGVGKDVNVTCSWFYQKLT